MRTKVLKILSVIAMIVLVISVMAIEGNGIVPFITGFVSVSYLLLIAIANTPNDKTPRS